MLEKSQSFDINERSQKEVQEIMEKTLTDKLTYKTRTAKLGKRIIKINYYDTKIDENLQKDNKILIMQDLDMKCHINFQGKLTKNQISKLWYELNENSSHDIRRNDKQLNKDEAIFKVIEGIESNGLVIDTFEAIEIIEDFQKKFNRFPLINEIDPIIKGHLNFQFKEINQQQDLSTNEFKPIPSTLDESPSGVLTIKKPIGRRICPKCGNTSTYKIHELTDKTIILCDYPRIYGKKYSCDGCRCVWREE